MRNSIVDTYISDIAIKSGADVHLAHRHEEISPTFNITEVSGAELQVGDLSHFHRLVADRFRDLLINLQKASEYWVGAHIWSIDDLLQICVKRCSSAIDLLICL